MYSVTVEELIKELLDAPRDAKVYASHQPQYNAEITLSNLTTITSGKNYLTLWFDEYYQ